MRASVVWRVADLPVACAVAGSEAVRSRAEWMQQSSFPHPNGTGREEGNCRRKWPSLEGDVAGLPVLVNPICQRQVHCGERCAGRRLAKMRGEASMDAVQSRDRCAGVAAVYVVAGPGGWAGVARWVCVVAEWLP
jgi:hypothetical protein